MALITKPNTFTAGTTAVASEVNSNFDTIYNDYNGNIGSSNLASNLALPDTQLAQITTASKVSGAAITSLTAVPSGAGVLPTANLGSGTADSTTFLRGDQSWTTVTNTVSNAVSGSIIQTVNTITGAVSSGSTVIPIDDTIPQITEGDQVMSKAVTPNNASNLLRIDVVANFGNSTGDIVVVALYQDSSADAIACSFTSTTAGGVRSMSFTHYMTAGTTSSTTFKVRIGGAAGTTTFNGVGGSRYMGGVLASSITIHEIKA